MLKGFCIRRPLRDPISASYRLLHRQISSLNQRTNFQELDTKWQQRWEKDVSNGSVTGKEKAYILPMFAYPSGSLHMGHMRVYTISDVLARHRRMKGYDVLHPTGWDAFGLPAENAAIERGIDPAQWTLTNIEKMKVQLKSMNTHFDWDAEISTCSPDFYKHTQNLFLMLHERGLAYRAEAMVNWDPVDKTVLAAEQVDGNGRSWRSGAVVQQLMLRQWFFKITDYKEDLLSDLAVLAQDNKWPERVISQQRNWIGRSEGARIKFEVMAQGLPHPVNVFTTRPDTLFGVKYLALSLSHPLVRSLATSLPDLKAFIDRKSSFPPDSKEGFELPVTAINPGAALIDSEISALPVFAAPYVLDGYGEGAVMGVPAHDGRDLAFWKQHRPSGDVAIVVAEVAPESKQSLFPKSSEVTNAFTGQGVLTAACGPYTGLHSTEAAVRIVQDLVKVNTAEATSTWRLRDWLISRQRYWGTPIPIVYCSNCGTVPVPRKDLPVLLPQLNASLQGQTGNPLDKCDEWVNTTCPSCEGAARRETDTMDTFVDSSWYYLRFADPKNETSACSPKSTASMLPVDTYIGGVEHAILHLLYARFIYKFLCKEGIVTTNHTTNEPFSQLIAQGMVHGKTFSDPETGRFLLPHEVEDTESGPLVKTSRKAPHISYEKMSKSKYNGIDPSVCISQYGADVTRAHVLFAAPVNDVLNWDEDKIIGIQRWLQRVNKLVIDVLALPSPINSQELLHTSDTDAETLLQTQSTLKSIDQTLANNIYGLNTYVSDLIKLTNAISDRGIANLSPSTATKSVTILIKLLAPITPAFAEECWEQLRQCNNELNDNRNEVSSIFQSSWPEPILSPDEEAQLKSRKQTQICAVQINGKTRFTAEVPVPFGKGRDATNSKHHEQVIVDAILSSADGQKWLIEKNDWHAKKRVIVVGGGKVVNVVF